MAAVALALVLSHQSETGERLRSLHCHRVNSPQTGDQDIWIPNESTQRKDQVASR